jgi:hypothetical protein
VSVLKPKAAIVGVFFVMVVPLWIGLAWAVGLIRIGAEKIIAGQSPVFEQSTSQLSNVLSSCLRKNYSRRLNLTATNSPRQTPPTIRFRNRALHMIVDVSSQGANGSVVRVYKFNDTPLSPIHRLAIQSCIPENALPVSGDPRNRQFYSGGRANWVSPD